MCRVALCAFWVASLVEGAERGNLMEPMERLERSRRGASLEVTCRRFAVLSGTRQEADDYTTCIQTRPGSRKGTLALLTEPAGDHPSLSVEACKLAQKIIGDHYATDNSLSLTSGFLGALDAANSAVLRFNYASQGDDAEDAGGPVPVRTGGLRAGRFKVGLTAVMLRADGTGIYLAQMAPAQAYIRHNGMVAPVPETPAWRSHGRPIKNRPPLSLVRDDEDPDLFVEAEEGVDVAPDYTQENLLAPALGTAPGIESDLMYRRVEEGDVIVLVSSGLARLLDRDTAEDILSLDNADAVSDALFDLAMSNGVAQAHACVLMLGALASSGVEAGWDESPIRAVVPEASDTSGAPDAANVLDTFEEYGYQPGIVKSIVVAPEESTPNRLAGLRGTLLAPKVWLNARKQQALGHEAEDTRACNEEDAPDSHEPVQLHQHVHVQVHTEDQPPATQEADGDATLDGSTLPSRLSIAPMPHPVTEREAQTGDLLREPEQPIEPMRILVQRTIYTPAYKAPVLWNEDEEAENAPFDGWEDTPPILTYPDAEDEESSAPTVFPWEQEPRTGPRNVTQATHTHHTQATRNTPAMKNYPAPQLFTGPAVTFQPAGVGANPHGTHRQADMLKSVPARLGKLGRGAAAWIGSTVRNMLPERQLFKPKRSLNTLKGALYGRAVPVRVLTGVALLAVLGLLAWSVLRVVGSGKQTQVNTLLQQAKQEDLLANQPSTPDGERVKSLTAALTHAKQAVVDDPRSSEAKLLVDKVQAELDKAQGVTRLAGISPLFDLTQLSDAPAPVTGIAAAAPATGTIQVSDIIVMSNDAYILDKSQGKVYRCNISAKTCSPVLGSGDTAAGQKVGQPVAMTVRVANLVVVDDKLLSYVFSPDTSSWQVEQLGDADKLQKPSDIATYDGNLYLLGAKSGQVSKYASGKYASPPEDWIKDQTGVDQMKNPVAIAIDGAIYVLLSDGKILIMQGGTVGRVIAPKPDLAAGAPSDLFTSTDTRDLYVLRATDGTITRISKEGQTLGTFKAPASENKLATLTGMTVDEGRGKLYLVAGQKVYQANLPGYTAQVAPDAPAPAAQQPANTAQQPTVRPTAEP